MKENLTFGAYSRSMNYLLWKQASHLMDVDCPKHRLTGTTADGYIYRLMECREDVIINYDEDAFLLNKAAMDSLIQYVLDNDIAYCGMPDGGVACRGHNPLVINPFFSIFNMRVLRPLYDKKELQDFVYADYKEQLQKAFPMEVLEDGHFLDWDDVSFEPYYDFFLPMAAKAKVLYLKGKTHQDGLSTILCNQEGVPFVIHTWYSREYNTNGGGGILFA